MSYRIYVNDIQLFGNNEYPEPFLNFLSDCGVEIDEECCFKHTFPVGSFDVMKVVTILEEYVEAERERYREVNKSGYFYDFSDYEKSIERYNKVKDDSLKPEPLFDWLVYKFTHSYLFLPLFFVETLLKQECIEPFMFYSDDIHFNCYKQIKEINIKGL